MSPNMAVHVCDDDQDPDRARELPGQVTIAKGERALFVRTLTAMAKDDLDAIDGISADRATKRCDDAPNAIRLSARTVDTAAALQAIAGPPADDDVRTRHPGVIRALFYALSGEIEKAWYEQDAFALDYWRPYAIRVNAYVPRDVHEGASRAA